MNKSTGVKKISPRGEWGLFLNENTGRLCHTHAVETLLVYQCAEFLELALVEFRISGIGQESQNRIDYRGSMSLLDLESVSNHALQDGELHFELCVEIGYHSFVRVHERVQVSDVVFHVLALQFSEHARTHPHALQAFPHVFEFRIEFRPQFRIKAGEVSHCLVSVECFDDFR